MDELEELLKNMFKSLGFKDITITPGSPPEAPPEEELVPVVHIIPIAAFGGPMGPMLPNTYINPNYRQMQAKMNMMRGAIRGIDMTEDEETVFVTLDIPGVELKDVSVELPNPTTLKVSAFTNGHENLSVRAMVLSSPVVMEKPEMSLNHGVLEIRMRRAPIPPTPK